MNKLFKEDKRHMIPRWNSLENAFNQHELSAFHPAKQEYINFLKESQRIYYEQCLVAWNNEKNIPTAVDLITQSSILGIECSEPKEFIRNKITHNGNIPNAVKELIGDFEEKPALNKIEAVSALRKKLIISPKDSLLWSELARNYLITGQYKKSERAILTAYYLTPNNRYILRNISRLFVHGDELDKALFYIRKNPLLYRDPWILSAEIALSNLCKKTSKNIKSAKAVMESNNYSYESLSELASELGTMEYSEDNRKNGKKDLLIAKKALNENAAAQIQWIHNSVHKLDDELLEFDSPEFNYEGEIYKQLNHETCDWNQVLTLTKLWHKYQPFSADPILYGSVVAVDMLDDPNAAIKMLGKGLSINKTDPTLNNNLIYSYIQRGGKGDLNEAQKLIERIDEFSLEDKDKVLITATKGLLYYRLGSSAIGAGFYHEAIDLAKRSELQSLYTMCLLYYAKELVYQKEDISGILPLIKKCNNIESDAFARDLMRKYNILIK